MADNHRKYWDRPLETMDRAQKLELQNERLRSVLPDYYEAPVINDLWSEAGLEPSDIRSVDDLSKAPIFRKDDIREYIDDGYTFGGRAILSKQEMAEKATLFPTTSGTTGAPTNLAYTSNDVEIIAENITRHAWMMGDRPGDTRAAFRPIRDVSPSDPIVAERLGVNLVRASLKMSEVDRMIHILRHFEPQSVNALHRPLINRMDEYMEEQGLDPKDVWEPVETATFGGEPLSPEFTSRVQEDWGVELFEIAGGLEPRWSGVECQNHDGFVHSPDEDFIFEVVDPDTGERLDEGERGELVMTTLSFEAMAHVRWGHEDIVKIKRGKCDCGRTGARIKFFGRVGDMLRVDGKKILPTDITPVVQGIDEMPNNYFQGYEDSSEALKLRIGYDPSSTTNPATLSSRVRDQLEAELGVPVSIEGTMEEAEMRKIGPSHKVPFLVE